MNELEIVINPYECMTRVNINGRAISPYSELSKYLKEPFYVWCDKVLDSVSRELNDQFRLTIVSRNSEVALLKGLAKNYEDCIDIKDKSFTIDMPFINRLKKLSEIVYTSKINIKNGKFPLNLFVYDVSKEDAINKYLDSSDIIQQNDTFIFTRTDYPLCNITLNVEDYSEEQFKQKVQDINFIITSSNENAKIIYNGIKKYNPSAFILVYNNSFSVQKLNNVFICACEESKLLRVLFELLEFRWIIPFYSRIINEINEETLVEEVHLSEELKLLTSVDPFVSVRCKEEVEINTFVPLEIKSYPNNALIPQLNFKFSKDKIVSCDGKNILALAVGEVYIEAYIQGSLEPISKFHIKVIQRNKIEKIELNKEDFIMGIQDTLKLSYSFFPKNADNQESLHWTSTDRKIATVNRDGKVVALKPGTCYIKISTEDVSTSCLISVKPKITNIELSKENINLYIGESTELKIEFHPVDVINSDIIWETSDKNVAIFENGIIKATGIGKAKVTFCTEDKSVSSLCKIKVSSTFEKEEYKNNIPLSGSIVSFVVSVVLACFNITNIIPSIIGIVSGCLGIKNIKKDKVMSIVFIILNMFIFTMILLDLIGIY